MDPSQLRAFITDHFDSLINQGDMTTIERNVHADYVDHDGPGGRTGLDESKARTQRNRQRLKDLHVEVRDVLADGDKVVVRNVWTATDPDTSARVEMHGFVLFRVQDGRLAERWATITEPRELTTASFEW
jgi:predicted SnoaL-like aldol condensation-catalyzing enzyme